MGGMGSHFLEYPRDPVTTPEFEAKPTFDPQFGFSTSRVERKVKLTPEEIRALKIDPKRIDYCVDYVAAMLQCKHENMPLMYRCSHLKHQYDHCAKEDWILRMKEYEREWRLRKRQQRIEAKKKAAEAELM